MLKVNFVPDDYLKNRELYRINIMFITLLAAIVVALVSAFVAIKIRMRASGFEDQFVTERISHIQEDIKKYEEFEANHEVVMKTALVAAELLEPVPKSILLALLTNNLPSGVSFLNLNFAQKKPAKVYAKNNAGQKSKYSQMGQAQKIANEQEQYKNKILQTHITIEGLAPSDLEIATYIEQLSSSNLLEHVALVEARECKMRTTFDGSNNNKTGKRIRQFKLIAILKNDAYFTSEDIVKIRAKL